MADIHTPLKLFHLTVVQKIEELIGNYPQSKKWFGWYTDTTEVMVVAHDEAEARSIAGQQDEESEYDRQDNFHWTIPELSNCKEILLDSPRIIMTQCGTG